MVEWGIVLKEGLKAGNILIDKNKRNKLISFINYLFDEKKILLFGPSGSGKSQFVESLKSNIDTPQRTHTVKKIKVPLGNHPTKFYDVPGHDEYVYQRREQVDNIIKGGVEGIINIVSYGYHESGNIDPQNVFNSNDAINESYLEKNKKNEINHLAEWLPRISPNQNVKWIINLVTKSDIWWERKDEVQAYYLTGEYGKKFDDYRKFMTVINLPYCSVLKSFFGKTSSASFGEQEKKILKLHLLSELNELIDNNKS